MPQEIINVGAVANDRTGDTWRAAMQKINSNFTELYAVADSVKYVFICEEADFPVQDATTITLQSETVHIISCAFTTAKRFIVEDGAAWTSSNIFGPIVTYTGSGSMFSGTDASFHIYNCRLDCPTAQVFDLTDTVGGVKLFVSENVRCFNCLGVGTFTGILTIEFLNSAYLNCTTGVKVLGSGTLIASVERLFMGSLSATFVGVDLGTTVISNIEFSNIIVIAPVGAVGLTGLVNSGNIPVGSVATVRDSSISGGATPATNIASSDVRWEFRDNANIPDSRNAADVFLENGSETITVSGAGDWYEIGIPAGGANWASDIADRFTVGADGVITYIGERSIDVIIEGRATIEKVGGGSDELEARFAVNWTGATTDAGLYKSRAITQNNTPTTVPLGALVTLSQNDNIRVIFSNNTSTADIVALVSSIEVTD